jgi:hypothetical protein
MKQAHVETIRAHAIQQCLIFGSCDSNWIAAQTGLSAQSVGQCLGQMLREGTLCYLYNLILMRSTQYGTSTAHQRYRFTAIGAIEATTPLLERPPCESEQLSPNSGLPGQLAN